MRRKTVILPLVVLGFAAAALRAAPEAGDRGLPPAECVRMLRAARLARMAGDTDAELETLKAAVEAFPEEMAPSYALLGYYRAHGLGAEERRRLEAWVHRRLADPDHPLPLSLLQQVARDPAADEALLRELAGSVAARADGPGAEPPDRLRLLAELQARLGQTAEAAATLGRLWERTGDVGVSWNLLRFRLQLGDWPGVLALMESVTEMRDSEWPTYVRALVEVGRLDEARAELDRRAAAGAAPDASAPEETAEDVAGEPFAPMLALLEELAWAFHDAGRDAEAEALFRQGMALQPDDPDVAAVLLHLYPSDDEELQARAAAGARRWDEVTDPQALLDEGTQRLAAGDAESAFDLLSRAAPHFRDVEAPWFNLGMAAYRLERWSETAEALGHAAELNPERAASFLFRGIALVHLERCGEAVTAFERALQLDPSRKQSHYYLAGCLRTLGRMEEAERHRRLYEASPPEN